MKYTTTACKQTLRTLTHPWSLGGVKRSEQFSFRKMIMLHIKLKRMTPTTTWKQFPLQSPSNPGLGSKGQNILIPLKVVLVHIKLKQIKHTAKYFVLTHSLGPPEWGLKVKTFFSSDSSHVHMKWTGCTYHGHLYHGWVGGELGFREREGSLYLACNDKNVFFHFWTT